MVKRPGLGTITARVWDMADAETARLERMAKRAEIVARAVDEGINPATANTQYGHWKRAAFPAKPTAKTRIPESPVEPEDTSAMSRHWAELLKNGFYYGSDWRIDEDGKLDLDRPAPTEPGVYVFVDNDEAVYVGVTDRGLHKRMADYRRGPKGQGTSYRVHHLIRERLDAGRTMRVLFATPKLSDWNGLPVDVAAGLEKGLIARFQPRWNKRGSA